MRIYLDHNAGTPIRPAVREATAAFLTDERHGNPASVHRAGQRARRELERARESIAQLIGAPARTIVFTSGGTESNNLAIYGAIKASKRRKIVTSAIEHSSIIEPLNYLARDGWKLVRPRPDQDGLIDPDLIASQVDEHTALVTIGLANAEAGAVQEIAPIADAARRAGALLHLDAAQAMGRLAVDANKLDCDLMTLSGHKIGAPSGIGALYVRPGASFTPFILGGSQENGLRAGTPNLLGAVGFGVAARDVRMNWEAETVRIGALAGELLRNLKNAIAGLLLNGPRDRRIANTLNLTFPRVLGESMLIALDLAGIEVSMGSACAAGSVEPSHVLLAMGRTPAQARSSLRISLGWSSTAEEIAIASEIIPRVWRRVVEAEPIAMAATS